MPHIEPVIIIEADEHDLPRVASTAEELAASPDFWDAREKLIAALGRQRYAIASEIADTAARAFATAITPYARELHPHTAPQEGADVDASEVDSSDDSDPHREVRDESARHGFEWLESIEAGRLTIVADGRRYSFHPARWSDDDARGWLLGSVLARRLEQSAIEAVRAGRFADPSVRKIVDRDREASRRTRLDRMQIQHDGAVWDPTDPYVWGSDWERLDLDGKRRVIADGTYVHPNGAVYTPLDRELAAADLRKEAERDGKMFRRLPSPAASIVPAAAPARPKVTAAEVENRVLRAVKIADEAGDALSKNKVRKSVSGSSAAIDAALVELVKRGELTTEAGRQNATLYRLPKAVAK